MLLDNLSDLFQRGLEYAWDCEEVLSREFPKMADAATAPELKRLIDRHILENKTHIHRLEQVFKLLGRSPAGEKSEPIRVISEECDRIIRHIDHSALLDAAVIFCGNQIAHYQIGLYGSLCGFSRTLGFPEVAGLLEEILGDEDKGDRELTRLAESSINWAASGVHNTPPFALI